MASMDDDTPETQPDPRSPTAAMLVIGDELLSGRTRDANAYHLAQWLDARGVALREVRMVPDEKDAIIAGVRALKSQADMLFTSGGIGPTHDDITAEAVAEALGVDISVREDALGILEEWYAAKGEEVTDARRRMARVPEGAALIDNSVSGAPGFVVEDVFVLAGVPAIFSAMLDAADDRIARGPQTSVYTVIGEGGESTVADGLIALEEAFSGLKIGSYPGKTGQGGPLCIVCRSFDEKVARQAALAVEGLFRAQGVEPEIVEGYGPMRD
ncbi:competence/damage-inducible protein A [Parvularcula oceani]|uniref:competence/damage-inducible protein A n=1 Tax=Parvularcula oceani TaxID=1247963 RepID=UPI000ADBC6E0|nr:molybdopterin-binding protein [Parvularcula oceani]